MSESHVRARTARSRSPSRFEHAIGLTALLLAMAGCAPTRVDLYDPMWVPTPTPTTYDDRDYATVLRENVRDGQVDYDHLKRHADPLNRYLGLLSVVGPDSTPGLFATRTSRLAYYLNAYNAGVLKGVIHLDVPETVHDVRLPPLEKTSWIRVDGAMRPLADVKQLARNESEGDARIELAMCSAARGSPELSDQPFRPDTLERQLGRVAEAAIENSRMVQIDHGKRQLLLGRAIYLHQNEFIEYHRRRTRAGGDSILSALLHLAGGARREWLNTAVGYNVGAIPFDRSLNRSAPSGAPRR